MKELKPVKVRLNVGGRILRWRPGRKHKARLMKKRGDWIARYLDWVMQENNKRDPPQYTEW